MNYNIVEEIYNRNFGSEITYKRDYFNQLTYTVGMKDFADTLEAHWFIDTIISHLSTVIKDSATTEDYFYVVELVVKSNNEATLDIFREGYIDNEYQEHILVATQKIPYVDLPVEAGEELTTYKFYLIKTAEAPAKFMLLLPKEY